MKRPKWRNQRREFDSSLRWDDNIGRNLLNPLLDGWSPTGVRMTDQPTIVAVFDVLGTKASIVRPRQLFRAFQKLREIALQSRDCLMIDATVGARENDDGSITSGSALGVLVVESDLFRDTIVLWAIYDRARFWTFCDLCTEFFCDVLRKGIPLRGAISVGSAEMNREAHRYAGEPYSEAVRAEKAQQWIGVSFGRSFTREPFRRLFRPEHVLPFSDHCKPGYSADIPGIVLDWPRKWRDKYEDSPSHMLNALNTSQRHSKYYELAIQFADYSASA